MPQIRPFAGIHFAKSLGPDISNLIAPPFDVLDEPGHANALVRVDDAHGAGRVHRRLARDAHRLVAASPPPRAVALAGEHRAAADVTHGHRRAR